MFVFFVTTSKEKMVSLPLTPPLPLPQDDPQMHLLPISVLSASGTSFQHVSSTSAVGLLLLTAFESIKVIPLYLGQ